VDGTGFRVSGELRRSVQRRLVYALSRFGEAVERVAIRLSDEKNAFGGVDKRCRMRAWLRHLGSVGVETLDGAGSIDRAVDRLAVRVEWALVNGGAETPSQMTAVASPARGRTTAMARAARIPRAATAGRKRRRP
jgi:hypothetical protein